MAERPPRQGSPKSSTTQSPMAGPAEHCREQGAWNRQLLGETEAARPGTVAGRGREPVADFSPGWFRGQLERPLCCVSPVQNLEATKGSEEERGLSIIPAPQHQCHRLCAQGASQGLQALVEAATPLPTAHSPKDPRPLQGRAFWPFHGVTWTGYLLGARIPVPIQLFNKAVQPLPASLRVTGDAREEQMVLGLALLCPWHFSRDHYI